MVNIVIVGAYPPPVGGNSIHIKRLNEEINQSDQFCSSVIDPFNTADSDNSQGLPENVVRAGPPSLSSLLKIALKLRNPELDIIHFHISAMARFIFAGPLMLVFKPRKVRIVLTIHSGSFVNSFQNFTDRKKVLGKHLLKRFDQIITVNMDQKLFLEKLGCKSESIRIIPAYLPPRVVETPRLISIVEQLKNTNKRIIISSGYGIPLYGFDKIAKAFSNDQSLRDNFSLVFCIYNTYDENYLKAIDSKLAKTPDFMVLRDLEPEEFSYILKSSSIYIRATDRDGDAVAIREASYYGLSVVASDLSSVSRPTFCHLFNRDNIDSLKEAIWLASNNNKQHSEEAGTDDNIDNILSVYKSLIV